MTRHAPGKSLWSEYPMAQCFVGGQGPGLGFCQNFPITGLDVLQNICTYPLRGESMKKLNKVASLFATAALAVSASSGFAQSNGADNWVNSTGIPWKNGTNELCWRDAGWTPATANAACDGALKPPPPPPPAPAPAPAAAPAPAPAAPAPVVVPVAPVSEKVTYAADAFYDTGKAVLKPDAKAKLDDLVVKTKGMNLEVIIAVGHTDSDGSDAYNQKLSVARAESVKTYLTSKGIEKNRVYTE